MAGPWREPVIGSLTQVMERLPTEIDRLTAWMVNLPMRIRFRSSATSLDDRLIAVVRMRSGRHTGWGEAAPVPGHTSDSINEVWAQLKHNDTPAGLAGAALAQAAADIEARQVNLPLWRHLGGAQTVWASAPIGIGINGQPDRAQLESVVAAGYRHVKLKITTATNPAVLEGIRKEFPSLGMGLDGNEALGVMLTEQLQAIDTLGFDYIEQPGPADAIDGHRALREELTTPISLDESAVSEPAIEELVRVGAADVVNLKAGRFGTADTLRIARQVTNAGTAVRLGGLIESGIGRAHAVALATCREFTVVGDIAGSDRFFDSDLVQPSWRIRNGRLEPTDRAGIGVAVDVDEIEKLAVDSFSLEQTRG